MRNVFPKVVLCASAALGLGLMALPAAAANTVMQECSTQYKADKAAGKLKAGETWKSYYSSCAKSMKKAESATPPEPGSKAEKAAQKKASGEKKAPTAAQLAARKRIKECGAMWQKDKAAGKIKAGETWPKYWHSCSEKLKG
ncbi:hypothetical protein [Acidimangrovimonas sediminis]|uniref:hypothetical protein n=1 Tax=Acidimangrovimonas sediminis TaxID=2056283 RepID=UPI000C80AC3D|nr:hypothetical protein [Acidimangrovimonas sediminis]